MAHLYELPQEIEKALLAYYNCFDEETGEMISTQEEMDVAEKEMFELQNQKNEILEWYLKDRANKLSDNVGIQAEIDRLQNRISINNKRVVQIDKIVGFHFEKDYNGKAINYGNFTVNYGKSKQTIIEDESMIPEKFKIVKTETVTTTKIPKADIKKAIENGEDVPGASVKEILKLKIK